MRWRSGQVVQRYHVSTRSKLLTTLPLRHQNEVAHDVRIRFTVPHNTSIYPRYTLLVQVLGQPPACLRRIRQRFRDMAALRIGQLKHKRLVNYPSQGRASGKTHFEMGKVSEIPVPFITWDLWKRHTMKLLIPPIGGGLRHSQIQYPKIGQPLLPTLVLNLRDRVQLPETLRPPVNTGQRLEGAGPLPR